MSRMKHRATKKGRTAGFTLMELLVTIGLLMIVMGLLMYPLVSSFGYFRSATARADAESVARLAMDTMARELAEAMYVQLDMYDSSMIGFVPPLRVNPNDPNSEIVSPPRPDWSRAIRYWRALHDPERNYDPGGHLGPGNTFYIARTVVPDPFTVEDRWNRWNRRWAASESTDALTANGVSAGWAPINRLVHTDVDWRFEGDLVGARNVTLQPGYPYLAVKYEYGSPLPAAGVRAYRAAAVGLTPNALDYDVSRLEFNPVVVSGEWLRPVETANGPDLSVYTSRYPLWRLGTPYSGWSRLAEGPASLVPASARSWARDPFLIIQRFDVDRNEYQLWRVGAFDPRTRTMKVLDPVTGRQVYDTGLYPYRLDPEAVGSPSVAFGITENDWIDGTVRFAFPPPQADQNLMAAGMPLKVTAADLAPAAVGSQVLHDFPLLSKWKNRSSGDQLAFFLVSDSVRVRVDTVDDGLDLPDRMLKRVYTTPRDYSDEFQVGVDPAVGGPTAAVPAYGWVRLPAHLADGRKPDDGTATFLVDYRWRSNGVWVKNAQYPNGHEYPDLVSAYYRTDAVIDICLTVNRADPTASAETRIAQSADMTRRVKLRNLVRETEYEQ